jgi:hypothetical protein
MERVESLRKNSGSIEAHGVRRVLIEHIRRSIWILYVIVDVVRVSSSPESRQPGWVIH